jgi:hypothetical protein
VTYYVLHVEGRQRHEFDDFLYRMMQVGRYRIELQKLNSRIDTIGEKFGAFPKFFRHERKAEALPGNDYHYFEVNDEGDEEYGLRLYCLRLTNEVVLLLNGGMKTEYDPENCPNCRKHFRFANQVARAISKDIESGTISIHDKKIRMDDEYYLEL